MLHHQGFCKGVECFYKNLVSHTIKNFQMILKYTRESSNTMFKKNGLKRMIIFVKWNQTLRKYITM